MGGGGSDTTLVANQKMTDWLTAHPNLRHIAVGTVNTETGQGVFSAVQAAERDKDVFMATNNNGKQTLAAWALGDNCWLGGTAYYPTKYGDYIIPLCIDIINGKNPQDPDHAARVPDPERDRRDQGGERVTCTWVTVEARETGSGRARAAGPASRETTAKRSRRRIGGIGGESQRKPGEANTVSRSGMSSSAFPGVLALDGVDLEIRRGEVLGGHRGERSREVDADEDPRGGSPDGFGRDHSLTGS